jgi:hypothetical protein
MPRPLRLAVPLALLAALVLPGCTALQELAALRSVTFAFAGVSDVRLVGIPLGPSARFTSLGLTDAARLGAAVVARQVPIELVVHASATNPAANKVAARMVGLDWGFFVEERQLVAGVLDSPVAIEPGRTADVPLAVRFDLVQLGSGGARDLFDLALAIAGHGSLQKDVSLRLVPTIETSLGPIRYPSPIVVARTAAR